MYFVRKILVGSMQLLLVKSYVLRTQRCLSAPVVDIKEENDDIYLALNRHCLGNDMVPERRKKTY